MVWPGVDGAALGDGDRGDGRRRGPPRPVARTDDLGGGSCHRADHRSSGSTGSATCRVVEEVVLGRTGEASGDLDLSLRVERDGRLLVHHEERFGPGRRRARGARCRSAGRATCCRRCSSASTPGARGCVSRTGGAVAWLPMQRRRRRDHGGRTRPARACSTWSTRSRRNSPRCRSWVIERVDE